MDAGIRYPLHRPEIAAALERGDRKVLSLAEGTERRVRAREALSEEGEALDTVFLMREGWATRTRSIADGRRQVILMFLPGDLFGLKALFLRAQTDAIEALSDGVVACIDQRRLWDAFRSDPDVALRLNWQAVEEERRLHAWVVALGQGDAAERTAGMILGFRGRLIATEAIPPDALSFAMPMTQDQMADHLGLSPVHVNRTLKRLRETGLATVSGGEVRIRDLAGLAALSESVRDVFEQERPEFGGGES